MNFDIVRDSVYPTNVKIYLDGVDETFALTGSTVLNGAGLVEVEIADILNMALRCFVIVQAIFVLPATGGPGPGTPAEPTVAVAATATGYRVTWLAVSGAESYRIYGNTVGEDSGSEEVTLTTATELLVPYASGYTWFAGTAIAGANESDIGPWATDNTAPADPVWSSHAYQDAGHLVQWYHPDVPTVENFVLYRNTVGDDDGNETEVATVAGTVANYLIGYGAGGDYFGIQAIDYAGNESNIVWFGPYDPTPDTPENPAADMVLLGGFVVSWNDVGAAARFYEVQGAEDGSGTGAVQVWVGAALMTPTILETDITHFRVRAVGWDGSTSDWTAWETDNNSPPPPVIETFGGSDFITVAFDPTDTSRFAPGLSHYILERADDGDGTGATTLDSTAPPASFPYNVAQAPRTIKWYRVTAVDAAGNESTPSSWVSAVAFTGSISIQDKFDGYGGTGFSNLESLWWLRFIDTNVNEWGEGSYNAANDSAYIADTDVSVKLTPDHTTPPYNAGIVQIWSPKLDIAADGRFTDNDYVLFSVYVEQLNDAGQAEILLSFRSGPSYPWSSVYTSVVLDTVGQHFIKTKKSDFISGGVGTFGWDIIYSIEFQTYSGTTTDPIVYIDDFRIVKADPDDADDYNDTGNSWDKAASTGTELGEWHVYPGNRSGEPAKPFSYGQIKVDTGSEAMYLSHKPLATTYIHTGTIQAGIYFKEQYPAGLAFFVQDVTPDNWSMYVVLATPNPANTVALFKWVDGDLDMIASASFASAEGQIIWLGVDLREFNTDAGRLKVFASLTEGNLIQASNLLISTQDTSLASGGSVGVVSHQSNVRFVDFTAGSPAHAEVADVALALNGPVLTGVDTRLSFRQGESDAEYSTDQDTYKMINGLRVVSSLPASPAEGDRVLLKVDPIFRATLNGSPANSATTMTVDTPSIGATTDTKVGHHLYLVNANGLRTYEGQISAVGSGSTLNVTAQAWSTQGWLDEMVVEVGARDSLWTYMSGHWVCDEVDYVEFNLSASDINTTSGSMTDTGIETNIIAPVNSCTLENIGFLNIFVDAASSTGNGGAARIALGGSFQCSLGRVYGNAITDIIGTVAGSKLSSVSAGNNQSKIQWQVVNGSPTLRCNANASPGIFNGYLRTKLKGRIKA
jgi:hypothetical protein